MPGTDKGTNGNSYSCTSRVTRPMKPRGTSKTQKTGGSESLSINESGSWLLYLTWEPKLVSMSLLHSEGWWFIFPSSLPLTCSCNPCKMTTKRSLLEQCLLNIECIWVRSLICVRNCMFLGYLADRAQIALFYFSHFFMHVLSRKVSRRGPKLLRSSTKNRTNDFN